MHLFNFKVKVCVKNFLFGLIFFYPIFAFADSNLNMVQMQLQAEEWVNTQSAEVSVFIDGTLDKTNALQMRDQIKAKLSQLANVEWHLTQFEINKNESGLEQLHIEALARVPENFVIGLRDKAKDLSKPGATFKIMRMDFTPTLAEIENSRGNLRSKLYTAVREEVARINKFYPEQKYILQSINFQEVGGGVPMPYAANKMMTMAAGAPRSAVVDTTTNLAVSNKMQMTALVVLTTNPEPSPEEKKIAKLEDSILNTREKLSTSTY